MNKKSNFKNNRIRNLALMAVFTALAFVVALTIRFPVPPFLTLDLKDAVIAIAAMAIGPSAALVITAAVALLEFVTVGDTGAYGLIMDILSSVGFAFTAALIYKYKKTFVGAIVSLVSATFVMTGVMIAANLLITPYYMGVKISAVREMIPTLLLPFNFLKATLNAGLVALLYKPLTKVLMRMLGAKKSEEKKTLDKRTVWMTVMAIVVIAGALLLLFFKMGAGISFGK